MNTSIAFLAVPVALTVGFLAGRVSDPVAAYAPVVASTQDDAQDMSPEQTAFLMPGDHHKLLDVFVGSWDASVTMFIPGAPEPMVSAGAMDARMVMDGRFLEQRFKGDFGGMPFEGFSLMGYNGAEKTYESVWIDNSTTDLVTSTGFASPDGVNFTMLSEETDMFSMQRRDVEERIKIASRDEIVYERWIPGMDGTGALAMNLSVTYKRKAPAASTR